MSTRSDIIKEALLNADEIHKSTVNRAKEELYDVFSERIEKSVRKALDETVGVGKDQPSGYNQDEDQDALAYGSSKHSTAKKDDINKGGKGPQKLEGSINVDEEFGEEEDEFGSGVGSGSDDLDVIPTTDEELDEMFGDEDDEDLDEASEDDEELDEKKDEELDEAAEDEEELDEKKDEDLDETQIKNEFKQVKAENKEIQKENKEYKKAFGIIKNKFNEVNLLNAKLGGAMKFLRNPNLTLKQKESIVETFDRAKNVGEVKLIVRTLNESYKHASLRRPTVERPTKPASSKRLDESFDNKRQQELAGIN